VAAAGAVVLAGIGAVWFWPSEAPVAETSAPIATASEAIPQGVTVHVSGEVASPGLVQVPAGSRIADVIAAAGGVLPGADVGSLNLAAPVRDGEQVAVVPATGASAGGGGGDPPDDGRIRVNHADQAALELLPGVGPVLAARILAHREQNGPFATVEDLLDVPGIGEGRLAAIRDVVAIP
jgi:competence protein ComEA